MRIYIAGPMTGLPEHNYPAFNAATEKLRSMGYEVGNPAELPEPESPTWEGWLKQAIQLMLGCDEVVLLDGWHKSIGARLEQNLAAQLRMPCTLFTEFKGIKNDN